MRNIRCVYYEDLNARRIAKTTAGVHPRTVIMHAVDHLQMNHYDALLAEVYDITNGVLHAVLKRSLDPNKHRKIEILYKRKVKEF